MVNLARKRVLIASLIAGSAAVLAGSVIPLVTTSSAAAGPTAATGSSRRGT